MPPLILASTSPYRRQLLERLQVKFELANPGIEEQHRPAELPAERASRLSLAKARAIAALHPAAVVIGSDQVASLEGAVLDKPGDARRCTAQLERLSGNKAMFHTGCAVVSPGVPAMQHLDQTSVTFRTLSNLEIARYVERERAFDCAGGFKAEGLGIALFERLDTRDPTALVGLPLIWLAQALRAAGYLVP